MLAFDKRAARYTWTAVAVLLLLYCVYELRKTLFVFVLSLLFAYLLSPVVDLLDRILPVRRTRTLALTLAYIFFVGILVFVGFQIGARVVEQANTLVKDFPALLAKWEQPSSSVPQQVNSIKTQVLQKIEEQVRTGSNHLVQALPQAGVKALAVAGDLVYVVVIPILAFFFLKDAASLKQHVLGAVEDAGRRDLVEDLMADVHLLLAHYMRALVILSGATFAAYSICFMIVGVPYTILLAAVAAALEFIPMVGPLGAAVMVTLVTAMSGHNVLPVVIFMGTYRVFQDYVLAPHVMGQGIELHPLAVLFGVFAGAEIAGVAGAFLSVPVLALLRIVYRRMRKARAVAELAPAPSP